MVEGRMSKPLLIVEDLRVEINRHGSIVTPVDEVSFELQQGEILGLVGESGSGKTLTLKALMGLLPPGVVQVGGSISSRSGDVLQPLDPEKARGRIMAMIFQEPATALNPLRRVRDLIAEPFIVGHGVARNEARAKAVALMRAVGIPDPEQRSRAYPHQLSGGLRQRVMIAMALATESTLLLCDEPTTALDVTIQDQILGLLVELKRERDLTLVLVTHDLAVVSELCDRVAVMYAGRIVETGATADVFANPGHPYTAALLAAVPRFEPGGGDLTTIGGSPPDLRNVPSGCRFRTRCQYAFEECATAGHRLTHVADERQTACIHPAWIERGVAI